MAVCKLFEERPVWPRQSLYERLQDDGVHVSQNQFKRFHCSSTLVELPHHLVPLLRRSITIFFTHSVFFWFGCHFCLLRLLFRAGYYFSTGPFGKFWIRRGYDPRKDPDSRM
jgi:general transcription factor 3C polypeptide 5 (transcription factor C subunit 1)